MYHVNVVYFIDDSPWKINGLWTGQARHDNLHQKSTIKAVSRTQSGIVYEEIFEVT